MFDRYIRNESYGPSTLKVYEHKAPTDESIRILQEMQEKAKESVLKTIRVNTNNISGVIVVNMPDYLTQTYVYVFKFDLNGKEYSFEETVDFFDANKLSERELVVMLFEKISKAIAEKLIVDNINEVLVGM